MNRRIRIFQHVPFEGPGTVQPLLNEMGFDVSTTHLYLGEAANFKDGDDALIVLGGPMSVHDDLACPWIVREKQLVKALIRQDAPMLGICLGAQMMADACGAEVQAMGYREIGWHQVETTDALKETWLHPIFGDRFKALHWHGEQFSLPDRAIPIGRSDACENQGFMLGTRQLALQFHLEFDETSVKRLVRNCSDELDGSQWVQKGDEMLADTSGFLECRQKIKKLVEVWIG